MLQQGALTVELTQDAANDVRGQIGHDNHVAHAGMKPDLRSADQIPDQRQPLGVEEKAPAVAPIVEVDDHFNGSLLGLVERVLDLERLQRWHGGVRQNEWPLTGGMDGSVSPSTTLAGPSGAAAGSAALELEPATTGT